eukprot:PITA_03998
MKYISWNCRGLGDRLKEEALKDIVRMYSPEILLIQETKLEDVLLLQASKAIWHKCQGIAVNDRGASRGIASFWDSSKYDLIHEECCPHWLLTKLVHKESGHQVSMFNLYAPVLPSEKKICWDSLQSYLSLHNPGNIIIAGDLNVTLAAEEKKGGSLVRDLAREWVEDFILDWELEDIKPTSGKFTWSNKRIGPSHIAAHLDRFLVQSSFLICGLMATSKILSKFSSLWIHQEGFQEVVSEVWNRQVHEGSPFFMWEEKMRRLKRELKEWAKRLKTPTTKRKEMHDSLGGHQLTMENFNAGDKNASYFHKQAKARKHFKTVHEIHYQNTVVKDSKGIKRATHSFFKDVYSAPEDPPIDSQAYPIDLIPHCVQDSDNIKLTAPISMNEIKESFDYMDPDKASSPDGLTARFYLTCWPTIKKYLLRMIRKSQTCTKIGGSTNSAFLALIPKDKGTTDFSRFRPISLCNTSYKLITKIIANHIKQILSVIILENQAGFIKGRKTLDNIVLVQEAIHSSCH